MEALSRGIQAKLPKYAQPLFIRLIKSLDLTGTYKLTKKELKEVGFDLDKIQGDPVFFKASRDAIYRPLTRHARDELLSSASAGRSKL